MDATDGVATIKAALASWTAGQGQAATDLVSTQAFIGTLVWSADFVRDRSVVHGASSGGLRQSTDDAIDLARTTGALAARSPASMKLVER